MSIARPVSSSSPSGGMTPFQKGAIGATAGGGIGAMLFNMFGDKPEFTNPSKAAQPFLDKIPGTLTPYYSPYIEAGKSSMSDLNNQYNQYSRMANDPTSIYSRMTNDPASILSGFGSGYKESPGYQFNLKQALMASNNAAAAGGALGSPANQQNNMEVASGLASKDYEDYLNHILSLFGGGLQGQQTGLQGQERISQGIVNRGYGASTELGGNLAKTLMSQADFASQSARDQNEYEQAQAKSNADLFGNLGGLAGLLAFL